MYIFLRSHENLGKKASPLIFSLAIKLANILNKINFHPELEILEEVVLDSELL
jgi:hypothetical protein